MSTNDHIEAEIARTTAAADHWRDRAGAIHTQLATASAPIMAAEAERAALAQAYAAGDLKAGSKLAELRKSRVDAEAEVADLQLALQHAEAQLKAASEEQARAYRARDGELAKDAARERVKAAEAVDAALANLSAALDAWEEAGAPLVTLDAPALRNQDIVGRRAAVLDVKRVGNAAAGVAQKIFPYLTIAPFGNGVSLAASERSLWHGLI